MKIIARNDEHPEFYTGWHDDPADEVKYLPRCACGGTAKGHHFPSSRFDLFSVDCSSQHCLRRAEGESWAEVCQGWRDSLAIDACACHSYVADDKGDGFHCIFCPLKLRNVDGQLVQYP